MTRDEKFKTRARSIAFPGVDVALKLTQRLIRLL